jgi:hypothetical protein
VGTDARTNRQAEVLEVKLSRALDDAKVEQVDLEAMFPPPAVDGIGKKRLAEAKAAWDDLDFTVGLEKAEQALEAFTAHPESADAASLAEVHFFIGAVSIQLQGKHAAKKGQESFARALLYAPALTLDEQVYGKEARKVFEKAQREVRGRSQGPLSVTSSPAGADVELGTERLGLTPLASPPSLTEGRHLVKLSRAGFAGAGAFADVTAEGATVDLSLVPHEGYAHVRQAATRLATEGVGSGRVPNGAQALAKSMQARFLVLGLTQGDATALEVWDVATGNRLADLSLTDERSLAAAATRVKDFLEHPSPLAPAVAAVQPEPAGAAPVYKKWWFWTAVGVVAVGGATAAGVAVATSRPRYNIILGTP